MNVVITAAAVKKEMAMTTYTIDQENNITAHAAAKEAKSQPGAERFSNTKELVRLAEKWPASRLVDIWNSLPGQTAVKKFTSRKTAVTRIWLAIQKLDANVGAQGPRVAAKKGRSAQNASQSSKAPRARESSKKADILALLQRRGGATLEELLLATGWQAHSIRGFISGAIGKKMGLAVESAKREDGGRVYAIRS
jgi:uncharacterized membrane protein